jgi:phage protein D/phage baseplate assembly protein gpV
MPTLVSQIPLIAVGGSSLRPELAAQLLDAVIDDDAYLPDMFELRFSDSDRTFADDMPFKIGAKVEIKTGAVGDDTTLLLICGEVTAIEATLDSSGSFLTITGYDQTHRLHRGRKTATFNDVTDSDLAKKIANAAGVSIGTIDSTSETLKHVSQVNESDWSFLQSRARESGYRIFVKEGKLCLKTDTDAPGAPPELRFGAELIEFHARMTANEQVSTVEARGWDLEKKEVISETMDTAIFSAALNGSSIKADTIDSSFGSSTFVCSDRAVGTNAAAKQVAAGLMVDMSSGQLYATGTIIGDPHVTAGSNVKITGTGKAFDGEWSVSHSRHVFDHQGYTTSFTVSGSQDRSLAGLISGMSGSSMASSGQTIDGVVIGVVTDTADPLKIGRVKVKLPWLADDFETFWCRVCYPGAGDKRGLFICPEINDEVLIAFEHGDIRQPFVIGSLYNGKDKPDTEAYLASSDGSVVRRAWTSRQGHFIAILEHPDSPDADLINLTTKNGVVVNLWDNGDFEVDAKTMKFTGKQDIEITTNGDIKISGKNVTIEAKASLELTGSSGAKIDGGAQTEIKGGMVKLN